MTKTPLVVRYNEKFGTWNVTTGKQGTLNTQKIENREEAIEMAARRMESRPCTIVGSRAGTISRFLENDNYWRLGSWTNEHPAPLIITPTRDGSWAVMRGNHSVLVELPTKSDANDWAVNEILEEPGIVYHDSESQYQSVDLDPDYWRRWM